MHRLVALLPTRALVTVVAYGLHWLEALLIELHIRATEAPRVTLRDLAHVEAAILDLDRATACVEAFAGLGPPVEGVRWVG